MLACTRVLEVVAYGSRWTPSVSPQAGQSEFRLWNLNPGWRGSLNPNLVLTSDHLNLYKRIVGWKTALLNQSQTKLGNVWTALKLLTWNLIVVWWGFLFVWGYFFCWWVGEEGIQIFLSSYGSLISLSLQSDFSACPSYSAPIIWSKIALFLHVPLYRQTNKT